MGVAVGTGVVGGVTVGIIDGVAVGVPLGMGDVPSGSKQL